MPNLTTEQLAARKKTIGSSEIATVLGCNPWRTRGELVLSKRGEVDVLPPTEDELARQEFGHAQEEIIALATARRLNLFAEPVTETLSHPEYPWATASLDFLSWNPVVPIEAKVVGHRVLHYWPDENEPEDTAKPPLYVICQVLWQLFVLRAHGVKADYAIVGALLGGRAPVRIFRVPYDEAAVELCFRAAWRFYHLYMIGNAPVPADDTETVKRHIKRRYARERLPAVDATPAIDAIAERLAEVRGQLAPLKALEKEETKLEAQLKVAVGDHAGVKGWWGDLSFKANKPSVEVDESAIARDAVATLRSVAETHPALGIVVPSDAEIRALYSTEKPGNRPLRVKFNDRVLAAPKGADL